MSIHWQHYLVLNWCRQLVDCFVVNINTEFICLQMWISSFLIIHYEIVICLGPIVCRENIDRTEVAATVLAKNVDRTEVAVTAQAQVQSAAKVTDTI